jgi:hypothetical protein
VLITSPFSLAWPSGPSVSTAGSDAFMSQPGTISRPRTRLVSLPAAGVKHCSVLQIRSAARRVRILPQPGAPHLLHLSDADPGGLQSAQAAHLTFLPNLHFPDAPFLRCAPCDRQCAMRSLSLAPKQRLSPISSTFIPQGRGRPDIGRGKRHVSCDTPG